MFASFFRADSAGGRSPWGSFFFNPVGAISSFGGRVTADRAMQLATVYACVRVLSESMAVLPFRLYRPKTGGGRQLVTDHWLYRLFMRPNQFQNRFEWREMLQAHLALRGNAYCRVVGDGSGAVSALLPIHPDRIVAQPLVNGSWNYLISNLDGSQETVDRFAIWHLRGLSSDGISGISPITQQRDVIASALAAQDYAGRFWGNDGKPGGWLEVPGKFATEATRQTLKDSLQKATTGSNRHKTLVLDQGMKYHEVGLSNKDSQFVEARDRSRTEIAGWFRVPPHMVGDLSRATFSNIEQQSIDFWNGTMLPWVNRWEAGAEGLLSPEDIAGGLEIDFDFREMLRGDAASRSEYLQRMVLTGILTRNEGRDMDGYNPLPGLDEPLVPVNEMTLKQSQNPEPVTPPGVDTPAKEAQPEPDEDDAPPPKKKKSAQAERLAAVIGANAARMARRIANDSGDRVPAGALAEALGIDPLAAANWLLAHRSGQGVPSEEVIAYSLRVLGGAS